MPTYPYHIKRANTVTYTCLEVDEIDRIKYLVLAFGASIIGFPYIRKVVVMDGTYFQGSIGETTKKRPRKQHLCLRCHQYEHKCKTFKVQVYLMVSHFLCFMNF